MRKLACILCAIWLLAVLFPLSAYADSTGIEGVLYPIEFVDCDGRTVTVSLDYPELKESYSVNLPETEDDVGEYHWGFSFTDGSKNYEVATCHFKHGDPSQMTLYDMQTDLWLKVEPHSARVIDEAQVLVSGTVIYWTFSLPEDFDASHFKITGTEIKVLDFTYFEEYTLEISLGIELEIPTATQFVPYHASIPSAQAGGSFTLSSGSLPKGLSISASGVLSGMPEELGVFSFTVTETYAGGSTEHERSLSVYSRMYADVESGNVPGYGFVETETGDGRVQDQAVSSVEELTDQVMHCEGPYPQFRNLYLDARKLIRDVEYAAEEGSTKITIYAETIAEEGGGTHTLAAEFETDDGGTVYTVQNYTVTGIASTEVHVTVFGETVIWTDAEPYIDTNSRTMTPFRVVGDALGLTIAWDSATREASFSNGTKTIYFPIGSTTARTSEGQAVEMDTSAVIVNGRTYAPVRYLAQYFGYSVGWERLTRTVAIE